MLERLFHLKQRRTDVKTEVIAGTATFMTMAYIIFVNPMILKDAGVPQAGAIVATALGAGFLTLAMGLVTNYPFALASGMGLNAFLTYSVVIGLKLSWQEAMGMVVIEGVVITLLVLTRSREAIMRAIPTALKRAIGVGIGLFIAFIGLQNAGLVIKSPATLVTFGSLTSPAVLVALFGLIVTAILMAHRIKGSILLGISLATVLAVILKVANLPPSIISAPTAESLGTFFQFNLNALYAPALWAVIFSFLITDFFDTMGTVVAIGGQAGFIDEKGNIPGLRNILLVDSLAAVTGGLLGASSITTYVESAAGVSEGGRTGLTSVVTAILFFLAIFFAPLIGIVPAAAVAPALIVVGFLMMMVVKDIAFDNFAEAFPAFLTIITIPLTFSIARGIGYGFVSYVLIKLFTGGSKDVHWLMWIVAALFGVSFLIG
jgi:AGZA family xanthine/uracil permease-like MFS transporter